MTVEIEAVEFAHFVDHTRLTDHSLQVLLGLLTRSGNPRCRITTIGRVADGEQLVIISRTSLARPDAFWRVGPGFPAMQRTDGAVSISIPGQVTP